MSGADLKARVLDATRREPSPTRAIATVRARRAWQGAIIVMLLVFFALGGTRLAVRPQALIVRTAVGWAGVALAATWLAVGRGGSMLGRQRVWLLAGAGLTPVLLAVVWFAVAMPMRETSVPHDVLAEARCFGASVALGVAPLVAFLMMRREGDPGDPGLTGAALGAAAGAWSALLIDLHCEMTGPRHVVLAHVLPAAALAVIGALAAKSVLAIRRLS
jgi:hypothetical protein